MKSSSKLTCFRCMTLVGGFLLMTPSVVNWYWGNLSVYTDSYVRARLGPDSGFQTPWTISCSLIGTPMGIILSDILHRYLGTHGTPLLACLLYNLALGLSFFTIRQSVIVFEIILGWINGLSFCIIFSHVLWVTREWCSSERAGFYSGLVTSGAGLGPIVITQLITWFINPDNMIPDLQVGDRAFFTQEEVLNRVPSVFLVLCGFALSFQLPGILLIRDVKHVHILKEDIRMETYAEFVSGKHTKGQSHMSDGTRLTISNQFRQCYDHSNSRHSMLDTKDGTDSITSITVYDRQTNASSKENDLVERCLMYGKDFEKKVLTGFTIKNLTLQDESTGSIASHSILDGNHSGNNESFKKQDWVSEEKRTIDVRHSETKRYQAISDSGDFVRDSNRDKSPADDKTEPDGFKKSYETDRNTGVLSPWEVVKNPIFYIVCLCVNCNDLSFILVNNYYKAYGQLHIKDDHFLADISTCVMFGYLITRVICGLMTDYFGLKNTLIFIFSGLVLGLGFWYFTVLMDKWLYFTWTVGVVTLNSGFYFMFAMCSLKLFGRKYYLRNLGLLFASSMPLNLVGPHMIRFILSHSGYSTLFLTGSAYPL